MVWTKWYGWNITDKVINQSRSIWQYDFFINTASTLTLLAFLCVFIIYLWFLVTRHISNSTELKCTQNIKLYHFVHTILSNTILSVYHFVRSILSATILSGHHFRQWRSEQRDSLNLERTSFDGEVGNIRTCHGCRLEHINI